MSSLGADKLGGVARVAPPTTHCSKLAKGAGGKMKLNRPGFSSVRLISAVPHLANLTWSYRTQHHAMQGSWAQTRQQAVALETAESLIRAAEASAWHLQCNCSTTATYAAHAWPETKNANPCFYKRGNTEAGMKATLASVASIGNIR